MMTINFLSVHYLARQQDKLYMKFFQFWVKFKQFVCKIHNFGPLLITKENKVLFWQSNILMDRPIYMVAEFQLKFVLRRENTTLLWAKNTLHKTLIHSPIQSKIFIMKYIMMDNIISIIMQQVNHNLKLHPQDLKFLIQIIQTIGIFNSRSIHWMTCKVYKENLVLLEVIYFCSICRTIWKIQNYFSYSKNLEIF